MHISSDESSDRCMLAGRQRWQVGRAGKSAGLPGRQGWQVGMVGMSAGVSVQGSKKSGANLSIDVCVCVVSICMYLCTYVFICM